MTAVRDAAAQRPPASPAAPTDAWLPAGQPDLPAGSQVATGSWVPAEIGAGMPSQGAAPGAVKDPAGWVPASTQGAVAASNVDATAATTALVPDAWVVEPTAPQPRADATATAEVGPDRAQLAEGAPTIGAAAPDPVAPALDEAAVQPSALLRFGLPLVVVIASLIVTFAIAGVFGSAGTGHSPATTPGAAGGRGVPATASRAAARRAPAASAKPARPHGATRRQTARGAGTRHAARHSKPAATPAPRSVARPPAPRAPVTPAPAPAPAPHKAPAAPLHATPPRPISHTRPTQRSGAPGRQPTSG